MKLFITAALAMFASVCLAADGGARCVEVDKMGPIDDGFKITVVANALDSKVQSAKMSDPGHVDIDLDPSYYAQSKEELTFSSNMTIDGTRNAKYARIVTMGLSLNTSHTRAAGMWDGVVTVTRIDLKEVWRRPKIDQYSVQCFVN